MIIEENVTLYHCEFCKKRTVKKTLRKKSAMEKHEKNCIYNPVNQKACIGCAHIKIEEIEYYMGKKAVSTHCFRCTKLDKLMFPFRIERKNLHLKYPDTFENQEPMPIICEHYKEGFTEISNVF